MVKKNIYVRYMLEKYTHKDVYNNYVLVAKLDSDDIVVPDTTELKKFLMDLSIILNDEKALKRTKSRKEIN